jgi:type II secretion system (T2SS) protein E
MPPRKRLGQLLTELGVIDEHQLQSALGHQKQWGGKLGAILVQKGFCNEDQMVSALTQHLGISRVKLTEATIDPRAQKCVSRQIAEKLHVFPYELSGSGRSEVVTIAMSDPTDLSAVDQLAFHTGKRIKPMLAGDSEVLNAIHAHYGAPEEKKEPTGKVAQQKPLAPPPAAEAQSAGSPPAAAAPRPSPYIPPPIPAARPTPRPEDLDEIEPDEVMAPPAETAPPLAPVDLPEAEAEGLGLEPIAAHSQFGGEVSGQEAVSGEGSAADAGAQGWGEASEDVPVDDAGWGPGPEAQPADLVGEELPADAILGAGAANATATPGPEATVTGWGTATEEVPAAEATSFEDLPGPGDEPGAAEPIDQEAPLAAADEEQAPAGQEEEPLPIEDEIEPAQEVSAESMAEDVPVELSGDEELAGESEASGGEAGPALQEAPPEEAEAEAPDAWASSEDPLAAQAPDVPAWAEVPREGSADHAAGQGATQEFANPVDQEIGAERDLAERGEEPASREPEAGWGAAEDVPVEEAAQEELPLEEAAFEETPQEELPLEEEPQEEPAPQELQAEESPPEAPEAAGYAAEQGEEAGLQLEGWVAPPEEPEPEGAGWIGEALEASAPLAPSDLEALSSIGLDPNDGVGALRLLAALVRILQRRQLIDPEELAAEIRESRAQGAAAAAEQQGAYETEASSHDAPDPGSAET